MSLISLRFCVFLCYHHSVISRAIVFFVIHMHRTLHTKNYNFYFTRPLLLRSSQYHLLRAIYSPVGEDFHFSWGASFSNDLCSLSCSTIHRNTKIVRENYCDDVVVAGVSFLFTTTMITNVQIAAFKIYY